MIRVVFFIFFSFLVSRSFAVNNLSHLFIEGRGQNIYESQLRANHLGMQRALAIIADRADIHNFDSSKVSYKDLLEIFTPYNPIPKVLENNFYQGEISYRYNTQKVINILLEFADRQNNSSLYSAIVIPIMKQNKLLSFASDAQWHKEWLKETGYLLENSVYIVNNAFPSLIDLINSKELSELKYNYFFEVFPSYLFERIILVIGEYFYNKRGELCFQTSFRVLKYDGTDEFYVKENKVTDMDAMQNIWSSIPPQLVKNYGLKNRHLDFDDNIKKYYKRLDDILLKSGIKEQTHSGREIFIVSDVYSTKDVEFFKKKISNIEDIKASYNISLSTHKMRIVIYTDLTDSQLAQAFYLRGLTYIKEEDKYILLNLETYNKFE